MKKALLSILIGVMFILAACDGPAPAATPPSAETPTASEEPVPGRPAIRLSAMGEVYEGLPGAYCWLQAPNDIRCEPDPLVMEPEQTIQVAPGDTITLMVDSEVGPPAEFYATFLDDEDPDGDPIVQDFGSTTMAEYTVNLDPGVHRIDVVAEFPEVEGENSFVTTIFALEVPAGVAVQITPRPTATTLPPTPAPAETEEPKPETPAPLVETPTMTLQVLTPEIATQAASPSPTPPLAEPSNTPAPAAPTATSAPPTPIPTPGVMVEAGELAAAPPEVIVINGGRRFMPTGLQYCYREAEGGEVCVDQPISPEGERILLNSGDTLRIDAAQGGPPAMAVTLRSTDLSQEYQRTELTGNATAISLHTITGAPGNYTLVVEADWPQGTATYYFRLQIMG